MKGEQGDGGGGIDSVTTGAGLSGDGTETSPLTLGLTNYQTAASIDIQIADDMDERQYRIRLGDAAENVGYPTFELAQNRLGFYCDQKAQGIVYESTVLSLRNYGQEISGFANRTRIELAKSAGIGIYSYTGSLKFNGAELNTANGLLQLGDDNEIPEGFLATTTVAGIVLAGNATIAVAGTDTTQRAFSAADIKAAIEEHAPGGGDVPESRLIPDTAEFTKDDDGRILAYVSTASYYPDDAVLSQYDKYLKGYISFDQATADVSDYTLTYTATTAQPGSVSPKCAMSAWSGTGDRCPGAGRKSLIFNIWWYRTAAAAAKMLQIGDTANGLYLMFAGSVGIWQTSMLRGASMNGLSITSANNSWNFITIALTNTNKTVSCTLFGNGVKGSTHTVTVDDGFVFSASTAATLLSNFNTFYDEISWYEDLQLTDAQILEMHQALYNSGAGNLPDFSSDSGGAGAFTDAKMKFEGNGRKFLNDKGQYAYPSQGIWKMRCPVVAGKIVLAHGLNIKSEEYAGLEAGVRLVKVNTTSESPPYGYATGDYATAIFIPLVYNTTGEIGWYENAKHCVELNRANGTLSVYISGFYFQLGVNGTLAIDTATVSGSYLSFFDDLSAAEQATWNFEFYIKF